MIAVVGLPYGRADFTAFAELYHGTVDTTGTSHISVDADPGTGGTQSSVTYFLPASAGTNIDIDLTVGNSTGATYQIGAWGFKLNNPDIINLWARESQPPLIGGPAPLPACDSSGLNCNPDFDAVFNTGAGWACSPPAPESDDPATIEPGQDSSIGCFNGAANGQLFPSGPAHGLLATVRYHIQPGAVVGTVPLTITEGSLYDESFGELMSCNPTISVPGACFDGEVVLAVEPTATVTNTPEPATATNTPTVTNTSVPPTATNTATNTPEGAIIIKIPEQCANGGDAGDDNADCSGDIPLANLFLCEAPAACAGQGEGNLIVFEYASGIIDSPEAGLQGLGAYEFSVEYDNFVISSINPCDIVFGTASADPNNPGGADGVADGEGQNRGPVDELNSSDSPYCDNDANTDVDGTCANSIVLENVVHFGCVTSGTVPAGPLGEMDLAALNLIPHEDLRNDIFPGNNNGVVTILKDNGCELVDTLGHPVPGSINGGLTTVCGDIAVTVRILEGDLDLDCDVDLTDAQAIAGHYGAFFGGLLYSKWLDLEPQFHDLDIDIKDIQKVFGRQGSTCQNPIPAQPPVPYN